MRFTGDGTTGHNAACVISLEPFVEGELVHRLPSGHLMSAESLDELKLSARSAGASARCPMTRATLAPQCGTVAAAEFARAPLDVLGRDGLVARSANHAVVSEKLGLDVSSHPAAQTKLARDNTKRLAADVLDDATATNASTTCVLTLLPQPDAVVADASLRRTADIQLGELMDRLTAQREADAIFVREALPLVCTAANTVQVHHLFEQDRAASTLYQPDLICSGLIAFLK